MRLVSFGAAGQAPSKKEVRSVISSLRIFFSPTNKLSTPPPHCFLWPRHHPHITHTDHPVLWGFGCGESDPRNLISQCKVVSRFVLAELVLRHSVCFSPAQEVWFSSINPSNTTTPIYNFLAYFDVAPIQYRKPPFRASRISVSARAHPYDY